MKRGGKGRQGRANTHLGISSTEHALGMSLRVYVKKVSTRKAALSYAVLTWRTDWPSCLGMNPVYRGAQRGLSMRLAQCTTAPSYGPVGGQRRADIVARAGPGQRVGEASEVGQARSPRRSSRQPQKTANQPQAFGARLMSQLLSRSPVLFSLSQCREAVPVPLPCQDAHRGVRPGHLRGVHARQHALQRNAVGVNAQQQTPPSPTSP